MITITCLADLDRAVTEAAFCHEPPLSERRAIHKSGAWRWNAVATTDCAECDGTGNFYRHDEDGDFLPCDECDGQGEFKTPHWQPAPFSTDPAASYALRQKMRELGWRMVYEDRGPEALDLQHWFQWRNYATIPSHAQATHGNEFVALCLAALRALKVEMEFREGWDGR